MTQPFPTARPVAGPKIRDFGEHIPGARKDTAALRLGAGIDADPEARGRLSELWPKPDWRRAAAERAAAGRDPRPLACARAMRDLLRTPRGLRDERQMAAGSGRTIRGLALAVLDGGLSAAEALEELAARLPDDPYNCSRARARAVERTAALYTEIGHRHDLGHLSVHRTSRDWYIRRGTEILARGADLAEAAAGLRETLAKLEADGPARKNGKRTYFVCYHKVDGSKRFGVHRKHHGRWTLVPGEREYDTDEEPRARLRDHEDEIDRRWNEWLKVPGERNREDQPRTPPAAHAASDPGEFAARHGFRGVQFGNWVEGARRRRDLAEASQALADLARTLEWPERSLSLGGALGLAFGARGNGGAQRVRAHYEPGQRVIAISKPAGPGTLAHEWFHAFDHQAAAAAGLGPRAFATSPEGRRARGPGKTPAGRLLEALRGYGDWLDESGLARRARRLDRRRAKPYWATTIELAARGFEAWVVWRLQREGIRNDYLANIVRPDGWTGRPELDQPYPYPYEDELLGMDRLLGAVAREGAALARTLGW